MRKRTPKTIAKEIPQQNSLNFEQTLLCLHVYCNFRLERSSTRITETNEEMTATSYFHELPHILAQSS